MTTWLRDNAQLASLLGAGVLIISSFAVGWHQLSGLVEKQPEIERHIYDESRHVNPEEQKDLKEQIRKLEDRVTALEARQWRQFIDRQRGNDGRRR